jgi:hypothetical protein
MNDVSHLHALWKLTRNLLELGVEMKLESGIEYSLIHTVKLSNFINWFLVVFGSNFMSRYSVDALSIFPNKTAISTPILKMFSNFCLGS